MDMREFTALKFRTMKVDTDQEEHRRYIQEIASQARSTNGNGLYKLERAATRSRRSVTGCARRVSTSCRS